MRNANYIQWRDMKTKPKKKRRPRRTFEQHETALRKCLDKQGITYTGRWEKKGRIYHFWLSKPGYDDRLIPLLTLEKGHKPFNKPTINEQIKSMREYAPTIGAVYERHKKDGYKNYFWLSKPGCDDRRVTIHCFNERRDPFWEATIGEQETKAKKFEVELDATYRGYVRKGKVNHFIFSKPGHEDIYAPIHNLNQGKNPFNGLGGFDKSKPGWNYIILVFLSDGTEVIKTGITNYLFGRFSTYDGLLASVGADYEILDIRDSRSGARVSAREAYLKRLFKGHRTCVKDGYGLELKSFTYHGGECFTIDVKDQLIAELKRLVKSPKMLK